MYPIDRSRQKAEYAADILKNLNPCPTNGEEVRAHVSHAAECLQIAHLLLIEWLANPYETLAHPKDPLEDTK